MSKFDANSKESPRENLHGLKPGDAHYKAFVGPPLEYDLVGAMQFRILTAFGLRAHHRLLDFGCGSLRGGRLLIPYLDTGNYFGVDPNRWLIDEAITHQVGEDQIRLKRPTFSNSDDFTVDQLGTTFDYVIAQSIFSHTGWDLTERLLRSISNNLAPQGLMLATFVEAKWPASDTAQSGWVYPGCYAYRDGTIRALARKAELETVRLRWRHPRQSWYVFARDRNRLPNLLQAQLIQERSLSESVSFRHRMRRCVSRQWRARFSPEGS